jgi:hypothetical protein
MRSPLILAVLAAGVQAALPLNAADGPIARVGAFLRKMTDPNRDQAFA